MSIVTIKKPEKLPKSLPQLMTPALYGLNKSFSKRIYLGFEIDYDGLAKITIRLTGLDFVGVRFNAPAWKSFVSGFAIISKFFATGRKNKSKNPSS